MPPLLKIQQKTRVPYGKHTAVISRWNDSYWWRLKNYTPNWKGTNLSRRSQWYKGSWYVLVLVHALCTFVSVWCGVPPSHTHSTCMCSWKHHATCHSKDHHQVYRPITYTNPDRYEWDKIRAPSHTHTLSHITSTYYTTTFISRLGPKAFTLSTSHTYTYTPPTMTGESMEAAAHYIYTNNY